MTDVLLLYADGEVRLDSLDVERVDVLLATLDAAGVATLDDRDLGVRLVWDETALTNGATLNLGASLLLYGTGRRPMHPIRGDVLLLGLTPDGAATDAPDDLLGAFGVLVVEVDETEEGVVS